MSSFLREEDLCLKSISLLRVADFNCQKTAYHLLSSLLKLGAFLEIKMAIRDGLIEHFNSSLKSAWGSWIDSSCPGRPRHRAQFMHSCGKAPIT